MLRYDHQQFNGSSQVINKKRTYRKFISEIHLCLKTDKEWTL